MSDMFTDAAPDFAPAPDETPSYTPGADTAPSDAPDPSSADQYFEVPNVGRVPLSELTKGYLRQADYTRKTQDLASQRRQFEGWSHEKAAYEEALSQIRSFLGDRTRLEQYLATLPPAQQAAAAQAVADQAAAGLDPDEILTGARVMQLMQERERALNQGFEKRVEELEQKIWREIYEQQYGDAINQKLRSIGEQFPELRAIPGMEALLRQAVSSQKPDSLPQVLSLLEQAAQFYSKTLDNLAQQRVAKVQQTPLARGIEPPSGAAPAPRSQTASDYTGIRDPRLRNDVVKDLMRIMSSARE